MYATSSPVSVTASAPTASSRWLIFVAPAALAWGGEEHVGEEELGEQGAFGGAGQLHGYTADTDLHRPEQPVPHVVHCRSIRESTFIVHRGERSEQSFGLVASWWRS